MDWQSYNLTSSSISNLIVHGSFGQHHSKQDWVNLTGWETSTYWPTESGVTTSTFKKVVASAEFAAEFLSAKNSPKKFSAENPPKYLNRAVTIFRDYPLSDINATTLCSDELQFWRQNPSLGVYQKLCQLACLRLSASASSVPAESMFFTAALVANSRQDSLSADKLLCTCFIHYNF